MKELIARFLYFFQAPTYARTLSILAVLLLAAAVPLTLYVGQQEQKTRQEASSNWQGDLGCQGRISLLSCNAVGVEWNLEPVQGQNTCNVYVGEFPPGNQYQVPGSSCNGAYTFQSVNNRNYKYKLYVSNGIAPCLSKEVDTESRNDCVAQPTNTPVPTVRPSDTPVPTSGSCDGSASCCADKPNCRKEGEPCYNGSPWSCRPGLGCWGGYCNPNPTATTTPGQPTSGASPTSGTQPTSPPGGGNACGVTQRQPNGSKCLGQQCSDDPECKTGYCCTSIQPGACQFGNVCTNADGSIGTPTAPTATTAPGQPTATATPAPGSVQLAFDLKLQGVGAAVGENANPRTPRRQVTVELFDEDEQPLNITKTFDVNLDGTSKTFKGTVDMGLVARTTCIIKVTTAKYLRKRIPGTTFCANGSHTLPQIMLIAGDINTNGPSANTIDILDYNTVIDKTCFVSTVSTPATCTSNLLSERDINDDDFVNLYDANYVFSNFARRQGD